MTPLEFEEADRSLRDFLKHGPSLRFAGPDCSVSEEEIRAKQWRWFELHAARLAHSNRGDYLMNCALEHRKVAAARGWRWGNRIKQAIRCEHAAREHYRRAADLRAEYGRTQNKQICEPEQMPDAR